MGQALPGSARTTPAIRGTIQQSKESPLILATCYGINTKTVAEWRKREDVQDTRIGPKLASRVLVAERGGYVPDLPALNPGVTRRLPLRSVSNHPIPFKISSAPQLSAP